VHSAPAHLESKLRFWDFSVGQLAAAVAGIMLGVIWAKFLSPVHGMWGAMSGAYIAALPVIPVFVASQTEFDLCGLVLGALRWRRLEGRYLPGAGESASGYVLAAEHLDNDPADGADAVELELQALWEHDRPHASAPWTHSWQASLAPAAHGSQTDHGPDGSDRAGWINNGKETR